MISSSAPYSSIMAAPMQRCRECFSAIPLSGAAAEQFWTDFRNKLADAVRVRASWSRGR